MQIIHTNDAPAAIGPYSQAIVSGGLVYTSGQIPLNPETGALVDGGIAEQTEQVCRNLEAVLAAADSALERAVKANCYLRNMEDFAAFNEVYGRFFTGKPARSCVAVRELPKGALVEVEVIAEVRPGVRFL